MMPAPDTTHLDAPIASEDMAAAYDAFLSAFPAYASTDRLDAIRASEYARLDQQGHVYLDYTGGGLYAETQVREHLALLTSGVFGNPHSKNLTSMAMTERVEHARDYVLR
jgi:molybdenum cofactor sulfurtransferase